VTVPTGEAEDPAAAATPSLARRMACFCYEALLLFGIALIPGVLGALFVAQTGQRHALQSDAALRVYALVLYGIYFVGLWSARGQTLAMQTWRIRVVDAAGARLSQGRALARYVACCIAWLGVPTAIAATLHMPPVATLVALFAWLAVYPLLALLAPGRQFWHDRLCGTRLVTAEPRSFRPRPR
jgi:uncharacterized RDD family membrane protein YckC